MASEPNNDAHAGRLERAQWLRAAILGANDGLLSTTALILGVGAATPAGQDRRRAIILSGVAGAVAGACSMAVGEFVSVAAQRDIEKQLIIIQREAKGCQIQEHSRLSSVSTSPVMRVIQGGGAGSFGHLVVLPNPVKAAAASAAASAAAFLSGAAVPLAVGAVVMAADHRDWRSDAGRIAVIVAAMTATLAAFGAAGARLGGSPEVKKSALRVVVGGWLAMALTYTLLKLFDNTTHT